MEDERRRNDDRRQEPASTVKRILSFSSIGDGDPWHEWNAVIRRRGTSSLTGTKRTSTGKYPPLQMMVFIDRKTSTSLEKDRRRQEEATLR